LAGAIRSRRAFPRAQLFYIALLFSVVVGSVLLAAPRFFVRTIYGAVDRSVLDSATTYLTFSAISYPFLAIYSACAALFRSMGNSRVSLLASLVMNVVNVAVSAVLIYGFQLGVAGAGIATLLSRAVAAVITLYLIRNRRNPVYLKQLYRVSFDGRLVRSILSVGVPTGFENGLFNLGGLSYNARGFTWTAALAPTQSSAVSPTWRSFPDSLWASQL
jgi:Na+-driven multidrug efflux pump